MFDWSDWNKRKRGRVRPIFNKDSKFVFRVVMSDSLLFRYIRLFSNRKYFSANKYRDSNSQHLYHETPTITPTRQIRTLAFIARMFRKYLINICTKLFPFQFRLSRDVWIRPPGLNKKWKINNQNCAQSYKLFLAQNWLPYFDERFKEPVETGPTCVSRETICFCN